MKLTKRHPALGMGHRAADSKHRHDEIPKTVVRWACRTPQLCTLSPHYLLLGTPGSGKTLLLKILMNSVLPDKEYGLRFRALVYDPKTEFYPFLVRMGIDEDRIIVANPFDARSAAWNLAADFRPGGGHAEALARAIIPSHSETGDRKGSDFFDKAATQTLTDVIEGLMSERKDDWELRDVVEACARMEDLGAVLRLTPTGEDTLASFFAEDNQDDRLGRDIKATLWAHVRPFIPIASLWHQTDKWFSVTDWHKGSGVILLGTDPEREEVLNTVNQLLVRRMTQVIRRGDEEATDFTWCFFDEIAGITAGFSNFARFLREARSKGARVVLACQDSAGLREVFGKDQSESLMSVCDNKALLHLAAETAEWASSLFAEVETSIPTHGIDDQGRTHASRTRGKHTRVLPVQFSQLPLAENHNGAIVAYFHHPGDDGVFSDDLSSSQVDRLMPKPKPRADLPPPRKDRTDDKHLRIPWESADRARFGLGVQILDDDD